MTRVLVIDDDEDIVALVTWKLRSLGHDVRVERDGEAGVAAAFADPPDLVVADWMMPRLTGIDVCRTLRGDARTKHVPLMLLTAKAQESDIERGFGSGADDYVVKPFSPRVLATRVDALLART